MTREDQTRPAFYAARPGGARDWWTVLHPPYTAWHLSYVVVGACLAPAVELSRLLATLLAFFLAVGVAAHAYDELQGRPLRTGIPSWALVTSCVGGLAGALVLGTFGVIEVGAVLVPFLVVGPLLVVAYNADLLGGAFHTDVGFALSWGAFPVLTAYVAQAGELSWSAVLAAGGATTLSLAQRALSTPARQLRRRVVEVQGTVRQGDGSESHIDRARLLAPLERGLRTLTWASVLLAAALAVFRLG
ncbi:MAG TPA: hypothetical protein VMD28_09470 [Acidimicrobiales bacterium]|nr:hypothetical protein [Acidimicrobiales bacterium]